MQIDYKARAEVAKQLSDERSAEIQKERRQMQQKQRIGGIASQMFKDMPALTTK